MTGGAGPTAFVLAGGGTKGAFEAGALGYLVGQRGILPDIVTGASAGAICAAVLAQARTPEEFEARVGDLRQDLLALTRTDLLFGREPWVAAFGGTPLEGVVDSFITERTRPPVPGERPGPPVPVGRPLPRHRRVGRALRALPAVSRAGRELRQRSSALMNLDPLAEALRHGHEGIAPLDPALVARPGLQLRLAVTALGAGVVRYVTEEGLLVEADATTPVAGTGAGPVDLVEGVVASASVPMVFPPRPLADDVYVDGGVVQNIPVEAAVRLGAGRIFAVVAVPLATPTDARDFTAANLVDVVFRAVGTIGFTERQLSNLAAARPPGVTLTVIDPVVDIVGPFEVAPGLMTIDMDYGWLRAADVLAEVDEATRRQAAEATDLAVTARTQAWHLEASLWSSGWAGAGALSQLRSLKRLVRHAVAERSTLGLPTPPGAEAWWTGAERHEGPTPAGFPEGPLLAP